MAETTVGRRRRGNGRLFPVLAVAFAAIAALLVYGAVQRTAAIPSTPAVATLARVVAVGPIPARTRVTADMVQLRDIPTAAAIDGAFSSTERVIGLVARYPIAANEQINAEKVGAALEQTEGPDSALSFVVPAGQRAVAIEVVEKSAVGGLIVAGDHVDVVALFDANLAGIEKAVTVLQNVEVLAVGQIAQQPVPPPSTISGEISQPSTGDGSELGIRPTDTTPQPEARTVTLSVTPSDVQVLALAGKHATLWLSLRGYDDTDVESLQSSNLLPLGVLGPDARP